MAAHRPARVDDPNALDFRPVPALSRQIFRILQARTADRGELRLAVAVLEDAFRCLGWLEGGSGSRSRRYRREARAWMECRDSDPLYSFENVCALLGLDAGKIRRYLPGDAPRTARWLRTGARALPEIPTSMGSRDDRRSRPGLRLVP